ncbi:MAG TPA: 3D domain-containing protein [Syntrophomonadaceae bacterium]|nr:3D domain-containing protein [Syntrophomonadaceae bacterium]
MGIVWSKRSTYLIALTLGLIILMVSLFFALQKPVTVVADGKVIESSIFFSSTVGDVLAKNQIDLGEKDEVTPSLQTLVKKDTEITVVRAFKVKVVAEGKTREIISIPIPIKEAIDIAGVELGEKDIVKTIPTELTTPNQEIEVIRVTEEEVILEESIPYETEKTVDNSLEKGLTKTINKGQDGLALNTVKVIYHNGEEVKREVIKSEIKSEPKNQVIALGNITSASRGGQSFDFNQAMMVQASAYTYTGNRTATGKNPAVGMVAVDPSVIPLGSQLYIEGYGYAVAADTGGSIKGARVDLFMEDRAQCLGWGRRNVKLYILQ